jgi:hypothetical protein
MAKSLSLQIKSAIKPQEPVRTKLWGLGDATYKPLGRITHESKRSHQNPKIRPKSGQSSTQNLNKKQNKIRIKIIKEFTENRISVRFNTTPTSTQRQGKNRWPCDSSTRNINVMSSMENSNPKRCQNTLGSLKKSKRN